MIDGRGQALCDGKIHQAQNRPRALLAATVAGPTTEMLHVCADCAPTAAKVFAEAVVTAAQGGPGAAMGGMLTFSLLPQPRTP